MLPDQIEHHLATPRLGHPAEPGTQRTRLCRGPIRGARQEATQYRGYRTVGRFSAQFGRVEPDRGRVGCGTAERGIEQSQTFVVPQLVQTEPLPAGDGTAIHTTGHAARGVPGPPRHRGSGQPFGPAALCERVEERVGGRVVALSGRSDRGRDGREQDEGRQLAIAGEFVQMLRRFGFRPEHSPQLPRAQAGECAVVEHTRRMHDAGQRAIGGYRIEQCAQRFPITDIAGRHPDHSTGFRQLGRQFGGSVGGFATPRHQQQITHAVPCDQMPGEQRTEATEATGDQDGAGAEAVSRLGLVPGSRSHQPRHQHRAGPYRGLWFTRRDHGTGQRRNIRRRARRRIGVDEHESARILRLRAAEQAPDRRCGKIGCRTR